MNKENIEKVLKQMALEYANEFKYHKAHEDKRKAKGRIDMHFISSDTDENYYFVEYGKTNTYNYKKNGGAILKWIMEGAKRVIDNEYHLTKPAVVENAINKYKESNDWFSQFLDECCEVDDSYSENSGEVYSAYRDYCARVGDYIRSTTDFYTALEIAGFQRRKTKTARLIYGLKLKSEFLEN